MSSAGIVFGRVIAKQADINKIGRSRQELERRQISFVESTGVGPDPAKSIGFEQADDIRAVPAGVSKLDGRQFCASSAGRFSRRSARVYDSHQNNGSESNRSCLSS